MSATDNYSIISDQKAVKGLRLPTRSCVSDFVEQVLCTAIGLHASDIHIEKHRKSSRLRFRLDGVLQTVDTQGFLQSHFISIITKIKILAGLNIAQKRLPQDGRFSQCHSGGISDIRVSLVPSTEGERVVLRVLDNQNFRPEISNLNLDPAQHQALDKAIRSSQGMILVTGPTGSGKTSTLCSAINAINSPSINIMTVEDPVEYQVEGINQVEVKKEIGLNFATVLRALLRQDPEVILVGEIRDQETADIALKAALTGHLVLSTLHTKSALSSIVRLVNIGIPIHLISAAVTLVISQRLLRKNCPYCKEVLHDPVVQKFSHEFFKSAFNHESFSFSNVNNGQVKQLAGARGCERCHFTGCMGRCATYEMVEINDQTFLDLTPSELHSKQFSTRIRQLSISSLHSSAQRLLFQGVISPQEYMRVLL